MNPLFGTEIAVQDGVLTGPWRQPRQMLAEQDYGGHASVHDDAAAQKLGFRGGAIEGPTQFSQITPLCVHLWGPEFLSRGCLSAHYRSPAYEGDRLRAVVEPGPQENAAVIRVQRDDGTEILHGTAGLGPGLAPTELDGRLAGLPSLAEPVILRDVRLGSTVPPVPARMSRTGRIGALYPFSLADKLQRITEPSPAYEPGIPPWDRPILPFEMISVLMQYTWDDTRLAVKGPAMGMFADQEIRLLDGPVFADEDYMVEREVVGLSGSRRTESAWIRTTLRRPDGTAVAVMLLNSAILKESYAPYEAERKALYG